MASQDRPIVPEGFPVNCGYFPKKLPARELMYDALSNVFPVKSIPVTLNCTDIVIGRQLWADSHQTAHHLKVTATHCMANARLAAVDAIAGGWLPTIVFLATRDFENFRRYHPLVKEIPSSRWDTLLYTRGLLAVCEAKKTVLERGGLLDAFVMQLEGKGLTPFPEDKLRLPVEKTIDDVLAMRPRLKPVEWAGFPPVDTLPLNI